MEIEINRFKEEKKSMVIKISTLYLELSKHTEPGKLVQFVRIRIRNRSNMIRLKKSQ